MLYAGMMVCLSLRSGRKKSKDLGKNSRMRWTMGLDEAFAIMDKFSPNADVDTDAVSTEGTESCL